MRPRLITLWFLLIVAVTTLVYVNHFDNSFQFDDWHAVQDNLYIRDIANIPAFFRDATMFSALSFNQAYRPVTTTSLAIDFWLGETFRGNGLDTFFFHLSTFIWFVVLLATLFAFLNALFRSYPARERHMVALFVVAFCALHPVMAETVNYIIQRADLLSTLGVVLGVYLYAVSGFARVTWIYLVPVLIGCLAKQPAVMFAPILTVYIWVVEEGMPLDPRIDRGTILRIFARSLPAWLVCVGFFLFQAYMTPSTFTPGGHSVYHYAITQPWIFLYYLRCVVLPTELSADSDWWTFLSPYNPRVLFGFLALLGYVAVIYRASFSARWSRAAFGLAWFLLALLPTSSFIPLAEPLNDHRMFFPYIGMFIVIANVLLEHAAWLPRRAIIARLAPFAAMLVLVPYAWGTYQRNEVWHDDETLWHDVTVKSPGNGRGLMNYGLSQMNRGRFKAALEYFQRAKVLNPHYHTLEINLGIANAVLGNEKTAEKHFKYARELVPDAMQTVTYYATWLWAWERRDEAVKMLEGYLARFPRTQSVARQLLGYYAARGEWVKMEWVASDLLREFPRDAGAREALLTAFNRRQGTKEAAPRSESAGKKATLDKLLGEGLNFALELEFVDCERVSREALQFDPGSAEAFNNLGFCLAGQGRWAEAREAIRSALALKPDFPLAKNNLTWIESELTKVGAR